MTINFETVTNAATIPVHPWTVDTGEWHNPDGSVVEPMEFVLIRNPTVEEMDSTDDDVCLIVD